MSRSEGCGSLNGALKVKVTSLNPLALNARRRRRLTARKLLKQLVQSLSEP